MLGIDAVGVRSSGGLLFEEAVGGDRVAELLLVLLLLFFLVGSLLELTLFLLLCG